MATLSGEPTFSPRVWGWSATETHVDARASVFPTRVGMVRISWPRRIPRSRFPHACGDGPAPPSPSETFALFSPRVWGWSVAYAFLFGHVDVFPTRVGMVRRTFLELAV